MDYDKDPRINPDAVEYLVKRKQLPEAVAIRFLKRYPDCDDWWCDSIEWDKEQQCLRFKGLRGEQHKDE